MDLCKSSNFTIGHIEPKLYSCFGKELVGQTPQVAAYTELDVVLLLFESLHYGMK